MSVHLGNRSTVKKPTDKLYCGVKCKDQFWITMSQQRKLRKNQRHHGTNCKKCLRKFYKLEGD